jgi:hypothetical protein
MSAAFYCTVDGEPAGPFTAEELKRLALEGKLSASDSVRKGADGKWVPASRVKGLFEKKQSASLGDPVLTEFPPLASTRPKSAPKRMRRFPGLLVGIGAVLVLAFVAGYLLSRKNEQEKVLDSFKAYSNKVLENLTSYEENTVDAQAKVNVKFNSSSPVSYNVEKTTSLVSPYLGTLRFQLIAKMHFHSDAIVTLVFDYIASYAFQTDRWVLTNTESVIVNVDGGSSPELLAISDLKGKRNSEPATTEDTRKLSRVLRGQNLH